MIRSFTTHKIREQKELTGVYWAFTPCQGEHKGKIYQVMTPSCWESHPDFTNYRGEGIYKTQFYAGGNIRLEFKGVSHTATVYCDGKEIASHYNAYTIFGTVLKDLPEGEHTLEIKADNRFSEASALHIPNDYMSYGGINRPVVLEKIHEVYINWIHVTPMLVEGKWKAEVQVQMENIAEEEKSIDIDMEIAGQKSNLTDIKIAGNSKNTITTSFDFTGVEVWCPENPKLYTVTAEIYKDGICEDDFIDRFGFREVKLLGKDILLNGKKLRIKGLCRHEDHPQFASALPVAAMAADLEIFKDLGANSVRTSHYPNDEVFLDLCDEQGILVWEENHARGLSLEDMKNPNFEPQAEQVIREMIEAHYNHPSIYIWGILNECASDDPYGKECYDKQFQLIKELDQSRPHSFASFKFKTDICFGLPDVVSYNIYPKWYHDTPVDEYLDDLYQWVQKETDGAGKPFLITEIGAGGLYGYRNAYDSKWTEEYQAKTVEKQVSTVLNYADCSGVYIWQFCDIRVCDEWFDKRPRTMNNKGIVDEYRRKKLAYDGVKRLFKSYSNYVE
ncbi:MAG: hypothetical protein J6A75_10040 [Lachnospiraceae bacterium]|nr:hypothetical protein [Lachnospiraceae bacterium]